MGYYELADDQDPLLLARAEQAEPRHDCVLPADLELRWAYSGVAAAVREASSNPDEETPIYGDFCGIGAAIEATYVNDEGVTEGVTLSEGDSQYIEQLCTALNALLEPVRIVSDISGGAIHGTYADRPAVVLYKSDDFDDVMRQRECFGDHHLLKDREGEAVAHWVLEAELFSDIVNHYHNEVKP